MGKVIKTKIIKSLKKYDGLTVSMLLYVNKEPQVNKATWCRVLDDLIKETKIYVKNGKYYAFAK